MYWHMSIDFFAAALKDSFIFPLEIIDDKERVMTSVDHVFCRPEGESASNLSNITLFGRSSDDMQAIEFTKQSCLQTSQ